MRTAWSRWEASIELKFEFACGRPAGGIMSGQALLLFVDQRLNIASTFPLGLDAILAELRWSVMASK